MFHHFLIILVILLSKSNAVYRFHSENSCDFHIYNSPKYKECEYRKTVHNLMELMPFYYIGNWSISSSSDDFAPPQ